MYTKALFISAVLMLASSIIAQEQWIPASGSWSVGDSTLSQDEASDQFARIDVRIPNKNELQVSFHVTYEGGGLAQNNVTQPGEIQGGFGLHIGVEDPAIREKSWGNGKSYLLWLNVDTRVWTREKRAEYYGLRAQVYRSYSKGLMKLDQLATVPASIQSFIPESYLSVDLEKAISQLSGHSYSLYDILQIYQNLPLPINLRFNRTTGKVVVQDPSAEEISYVFYLDPEFLQGDYMSLRTNNLALKFSKLRVY